MIGKVIEGRYEGAVVLKLPNKNVLYIETEDSTKVALSKNNVISMADVSDQYPSYGRSVKMVMWNDFVTSIILFGAVPSEQNDSIELPDLLTEKENTTEAVSKKKTKNLLWLLPVVGAIAILSIILLLQFPSAQDSNADVPSVPSEVIQVAEELENTTVSAEALLQVEYQKAEELLTQGDFEAAAIAFEALGEYADSSEKILECKYLLAEELLSQGDYEIAAIAFEELSEYSNSAEMVLKCKYLHAENLMSSKKYSQASELFRELGNYSDSQEKLDICSIGVDYERAQSYKDNKQYYDAAVLFYSLQGFEDSKEQSFACWREITNSDSPIRAVDCHVVAIRNDGTVVSTGRNAEGQINVSGWKDIVAISTWFDKTVGLKSDGTVVATGSNLYNATDVDDWTDIVAISSSGRPTVGLKSDGTVVAVGYNFDGQCDAVSRWSDIVRIETFYTTIVGWKSDGSIVAAGPNSHNLLDIANWTDVVDVGIGMYHAVGLKADGTAVALGGNGRGQCDVDGWSDLVAVYASSTYTIGLKADGTVLVAGWDKSDAWNISDWTDIVSIELSDFHAVGLKSDGTVVAAGHNYYGQCSVSNWKDIVAICADSYSTVGLKADGSVVAVGKNDEGQCNVDDWQDVLVVGSERELQDNNSNNKEASTGITSVLYNESGKLLKADEFVDVYESIVDIAHQRYYSSSVSIEKVANSGLMHNYGFYIDGKASSTTIGFSYRGNDTLADGTFDQIIIMHYSGSSEESADAFFFISTLMSMATPSVGNVWDSTEIIEEMLVEISDSGDTATYKADGIVYTLGAIAMGGKTMMTFVVKIQ